jgi:hypothetical protein
VPLIIDWPADALQTFAKVRAEGTGYWRAYEHIRDQTASYSGASQLAAEKQLIHDTHVWYKLAAEINNPGSTTFIHLFTRSYLCAETFRQTGIEIEPSGRVVQRNSDTLARQVLDMILSGEESAIKTFDVIGPIDTKCMTEHLIPGRRLERTVWPAYAQWAWIATSRRFRHRIRQLFPCLRLDLPEAAAPSEYFHDEGFLQALSEREKQIIIQMADFSYEYVKRCRRAERGTVEFFGPLRHYLVRGADRRSLSEAFN